MFLRTYIKQVPTDCQGTFYPALETKGADTPVSYNIHEYLRGVHLRFCPEGCDNDNITSHAMREKVQLQQNVIFDMYGVPKRSRVLKIKTVICHNCNKPFSSY